MEHTTYETEGHWFPTPEARDISGNDRAAIGLRPAICAVEMTRPPAK